MTASSFSRSLDVFGARVTALPEQAAAIAADALRDEAAGRTPVRTGRLQSGWTIDPAAGPVVRVINDVPYAAAVEYGARGRPGAAMARGAVLAIGVQLDDLLAGRVP